MNDSWILDKSTSKNIVLLLVVMKKLAQIATMLILLDLENTTTQKLYGIGH
jgi:hypothetical protein